MKGGCAIRPLDADSAPRLRALAGPQGEGLVGSPGFHVLGAICGNRLAGYAVGRYAWGKLHVWEILVQQDLRGRGIGRRLMEGLIAHARRKRLPEVYLEVRERNWPALNLYSSLGFKPRVHMPKELFGHEGFYGLFLPLRRRWRQNGKA